MFKNKKKIIYSLLAATLISSSAASAASYDYTNVRYDYYNNYNSGYNQSYGNNTTIKQNTVVNKYPTFTWTIVNTSWKPAINKPTPPIVVEKPQVPDAKPDYGQEDNWTPSYPTKPNYPSTPNVPEPKPEVPAPKPEVPKESVSGISSIEMEVIRLVNIERQRGGMSPLAASSSLSNVARKKSEDMGLNNYFSHTSPTYGSSSNMMKTFGINSSYSGENIAKGQLSAGSVVSAWMNSSGHRDNIMNPSFKTIGVGYYQTSNGTNLWTQMFTN